MGNAYGSTSNDFRKMKTSPDKQLAEFKAWLRYPPPALN